MFISSSRAHLSAKKSFFTRNVRIVIESASTASYVQTNVSRLLHWSLHELFFRLPLTIYYFFFFFFSLIKQKIVYFHSDRKVIEYVLFRNNKDTRHGGASFFDWITDHYSQFRSAIWFFLSVRSAIVCLAMNILCHHHHPSLSAHIRRIVYTNNTRLVFLSRTYKTMWSVSNSNWLLFDPVSFLILLRFHSRLVII